MRIAVVGASGFIGRAVLSELTKRGISAVAVSRKGNIQSANHREFLCDIHETGKNFYEMLDKPDTVIHLAWGRLDDYRSLYHLETELPAQFKFLKGLIESGVKTLFVAGTCLEYGMQYGPLREDMPTNPNTPYGLAKDSLRRQLEFLKRVVPFNLIWGRIFYVYGEGQSPKSIYSQLKEAVKRGEETFNMSLGEQLRDYLPVEEVARIIVDLVLLGRDIGVINICSGKPISIRRLVESWISENGWDIELNLGYYPYPDYEPLAFWGDRGKLNTILESL